MLNILRPSDQGYRPTFRAPIISGCKEHLTKHYSLHPRLSCNQPTEVLSRSHRQSSVQQPRAKLPTTSSKDPSHAPAQATQSADSKAKTSPHTCLPRDPAPFAPFRIILNQPLLACFIWKFFSFGGWLASLFFIPLW